MDPCGASAVEGRGRLIAHLTDSRLALCVAALLMLVASACSGTRGYPGAERPAYEVGRVVAEFEVIPGGIRATVVGIESIDGATELGDWKSGNAVVELLPGTYEFVFSIDWDHSPFHSPSDDDERLKRRVQLELRPGYTHHVAFDIEHGFYFDVITPNAQGKRIDLPRSGRERCRRALTDFDRARCVREIEGLEHIDPGAEEPAIEREDEADAPSPG